MPRLSKILSRLGAAIATVILLVVTVPVALALTGALLMWGLLLGGIVRYRFGQFERERQATSSYDGAVDERESAIEGSFQVVHD